MMAKLSMGFSCQRPPASSDQAFGDVDRHAVLAVLDPLAELLGRLALVGADFAEERHQARINSVGLVPAVFALELPTQQSASATGDACHVFPPLTKQALQR
jgi:hypothetical protein